MGYIYKFTNKHNNKVYIGQTSLDPNIRYRSHVNSSYNVKSNDYDCVIHRAIRKYGIDSFDFEIVEEIDNKHLDAREVYWIKFYNSYFNGYNMTIGGNGAKKYDDNMLLECWNTSDNIVEAANEIGCDRGHLSKRLQSIGVNKCDIKKKRYKSIQNKRGFLIYKYDLNGNYLESFSSINDARRKTGISHIELCIDGKTNTAGGYIWSKNKFERFPIKDQSNNRCGQKKKIVAYDRYGRLIKKFNSIREASIQLNLDFSNISKACRGIQKTCGGYVWKYV